MRFLSYLICAALLVNAGRTASKEVSYEELANSSKEPQNWLTYSGDYRGWRHSLLLS